MTASWMSASKHWVAHHQNTLPPKNNKLPFSFSVPHAQPRTMDTDRHASVKTPVTPSTKDTVKHMQPVTFKKTVVTHKYYKKLPSPLLVYGTATEHTLATLEDLEHSLMQHEPVLHRVRLHEAFNKLHEIVAADIKLSVSMAYESGLRQARWKDTVANTLYDDAAALADSLRSELFEVTEKLAGAEAEVIRLTAAAESEGWKSIEASIEDILADPPDLSAPDLMAVGEDEFYTPPDSTFTITEIERLLED